MRRRKKSLTELSHALATEVQYDNIKDAVCLLTGERRETFQYERAIKLFQFQVWILFPRQSFFELAGLTAATKILEHILDEDFVEKEQFRQSDAPPWVSRGVFLNERPTESLNLVRARIPKFKMVYDAFLAERGGLNALLNALPPSELDAELRKRIANCTIVTALIDYRLRYALTIGAGGDAATLNHAKYFEWWPTRNESGGRGKKLPGKSSSKTVNKWWKEWRHTFLNERGNRGRPSRATSFSSHTPQKTRRPAYRFCCPSTRSTGTKR
jgi:hypothetical protein